MFSKTRPRSCGSCSNTRPWPDARCSYAVQTAAISDSLSTRQSELSVKTCLAEGGQLGWKRPLAFSVKTGLRVIAEVRKDPRHASEPVDAG